MKCAIMISFVLTILLFETNKTLAKDPTDRWIELDLYWFDQDNKKESAVKFWERYHTLLSDVSGWKGVIINIGWSMDFLLEWDGDVKKDLKLPKGLKTYPFFKDLAQLSGSSEERYRLNKERFKNADEPAIVDYGRWTYRDIRELVLQIRKVGKEKYGMADLRIGTYVLGFKEIYGGETMSFYGKHPNMFRDNVCYDGYSFPDFESFLSADKNSYASFPKGIPEGTPFNTFFALQWGSLSKVLGLDVIVFRDSFLGVGVYDRNGPYGKKAPAEPEKVARWSEATADLVKQTKLANPKALVIGYSSAASAVSDWRVNCFDLEAIAKEGYLDAWIDQTWAGAWNEVAQRPPPYFWNAPTLGWSYQLANILVHAAVLAETKVRHYILVGIYDSWESWDVINTAPESLRWSIWAYSHAAVKMPDSLKMPQGAYISWCNKGKELLSEKNVQFLRKNINEAFADAQQVKEVFGPTLVYNRSAMQWQSENKPDQNIREWIDEQAGTLSKWHIPILSITRSEYTAKVKSDMFIYQTPVHLPENEKQTILNQIKSGQPIMIIGSPVGGLDPEIAAMVGVSTQARAVDDIEYVGSINGRTSGLYKDLPNTFPLFQPYSRNEASPECEIVYSVRNSPCLIFNRSAGKQALFWDAPELSVNIPFKQATGKQILFGDETFRFDAMPGGSDFGRSTDQILGSPTSFVLAARHINDLMKKNGKLNVAYIDQYNPLHISAWQLRNGEFRILTAAIEEGINHGPDQTRTLELNIPEEWVDREVIIWENLWGINRYSTNSRKLFARLEQSESRLYRFVMNNQ